jgi:hypothetical protein
MAAEKATLKVIEFGLKSRSFSCAGQGSACLSEFQ